MNQLVVTFVSTSHAIAAEQLLLQKGIAAGVMPLPAALRAGCGLCLRIPPSHLSAVRQALQSAPEINYEIFARTATADSSQYERLGGNQD